MTVGMRVRIPAYADEFMAGITHGKVTKIQDGIATVKLTPALRFPSDLGPGTIRRTARYRLKDLRT